MGKERSRKLETMNKKIEEEKTENLWYVEILTRRQEKKEVDGIYKEKEKTGDREIKR